MAYGCAGDGGGGSGGTNDHRLLAGRNDPNQHPATAVSVDTDALPDLPSDAKDVQSVLAVLSQRGGGAEETTQVAVTALGAFRAVAFRADGAVELASHDNPEHVARLAGITLAAAEVGKEARIRLTGMVFFNGWSWTPGYPVYVGVAGGLTQTPPATGFVQRIGIAIGGDAVLVQIEPPVRRL